MVGLNTAAAAGCWLRTVILCVNCLCGFTGHQHIIRHYFEVTGVLHIFIVVKLLSHQTGR